ncbi:hypothetical protein EIP86_008470 [Pleurotus ostreatoroseus]|nr:hypothetical protein EIP86_008470 [Pleurotus ostreatoroseus]
MSSSTSQTANARRLQERTAQRAVTAERKKKAAEALKDKGNEFYRNGNYKEALKCYEDAILEYGPRAVYVEAESAAFQALERDHKLLKARFRRGLARKGNQCYHGAFADFTNVLEQDPTCLEAAVELREVADCLDDDRLPCLDSAEDMTDDEKPLPGDPDEGYETGYESDSSDYHHKGNGRPCRFYNHDGCTRGAQCKFKHAPDDRSVRDKL